MSEEKMREEFKKEFAQPPYEWMFTRFGEEQSWPGHYRDYSVQCAWEGYQAACASKQKEIDSLIEAMQEVLRISDRKHDAWDKVYALIAKMENQNERN